MKTADLKREQTWRCWTYAKQYGVMYVVSRINYTYPAAYIIERKTSGQSEYLGNEAQTLAMAARIIQSDAARIQEAGEVHPANEQVEFQEGSE